MDKREQLIAIATQLFSEKGYENTPLSLICDTAKVSKGLISHHFKSKDGLLREIFMRTTHMIITMNTNVKPDLSPKDRLLELLKSFFNQLEDDKLLFQFNLNIIVQPSTREILKDLIEERAAFILRATQDIFDGIDTCNSLVNSHMFIAELDGIAMGYLGVYRDFPLKDVKELLLKKYTA